MDSDLLNSLKRCASVPSIINKSLPQQNNLSNIKVEMSSSTQSQSTTPTPNSSGRDTVPSIFTMRARRHSASFSPLSAGAASNCNGPRLTPRVSQLRQEECADITNSREVNHEREVHTAIQMSQSWEDLTLFAENLVCRSDDNIANPLHVYLPSGPPICSSPSPTRSGLRLPYSGLSPSPTRKTFQTRRSMSPNPNIRPSSLSTSLNTVKRKFELDDCTQSYSPPPFKKAFTERGQTPSPVCPSPESYEGRTTPKLFPTKFYTCSSTSSSSVCSSPLASSLMEVPLDLNINNLMSNTLPHSSSSSSSSSSMSQLAQDSNPHNCNAFMEKITEEFDEDNNANGGGDIEISNADEERNDATKSDNILIIDNNNFNLNNSNDNTISSSNNNNNNNNEVAVFSLPTTSTTESSEAMITSSSSETGTNSANRYLCDIVEGSEASPLSLVMENEAEAIK